MGSDVERRKTVNADYERKKTRGRVRGFWIAALKRIYLKLYVAVT